jgi:hypothetical protein
MKQRQHEKQMAAEAAKRQSRNKLVGGFASALLGAFFNHKKH